MTTISQIIEGLTDNYTSTGTLSRILADNNEENQDESENEYSDNEKEDDGDIIMNMNGGETGAASAQEKPKKVSKGPRLDRVMEDDDFIPELRLKNDLLLKYLTLDKLEQMLDYIIIEPNLLTDTPQRCYKLPFAATEAFCMDIPHIKNALFPQLLQQQQEEGGEVEYRILSKLFSFITHPSEQIHTGIRSNQASNTLNHTLGGYFNKIISFWLIKETERMLEFLIKERYIVACMFETHLFGLSSCVTDLIVRFCTVHDIQGLDPLKFKSLRSEILQHCINCLEQNSEDDFVTEQIFEILTSIVRRCYQMYQARDFFDQLMSPFILQPILHFTFNLSPLPLGVLQFASKQGCAFLRVLFLNMFIAEPHHALQDVMEINFGFQLESVAGVNVADQINKNKDKEESKGEGEGEGEKQSSVTNSEFSAMKQEEMMKERLLKGVNRIYEQHEVNPLLAQQIVTFLPRYEQLFSSSQVVVGGGLQVGTRVKLYELLESLINLDNLIVNIAIKDRRFAEFVMEDYERFDSNSQVLSQLNKVIMAMTLQTACFDMKVRLFKGPASLQSQDQPPTQQLQSQQLLFRLAKRLSLSEFTQTQSKRKDIYAYIHQLVKELLKVCEDQQSVKKLLADCEPNWTALRKALEEEETYVASPWGERLIPETPVQTGRPPDVIRKHEEQASGLNLSDKGAASTTKKIVQSSVQSRKKMMMFDDALK